MKKLQAAMRDASAKRWREAKVGYRVGSYFKGCRNCGETTFVQWGNRMKEVWLSGYQVFRSYEPNRIGIGWTYWCYECGAKDHQCWDNANDIGQPAIVGARDVVSSRKAEIRKDRAENNRKAMETIVQRKYNPVKSAEIDEIKAEIAKLQALLNKQKEV